MHLTLRVIRRDYLLCVSLLFSAVHCGGAESFSLLTYNVAGNGATNWSTNALQVQAIGREVSYLQPDIITFQEIPYIYTWQMTNFVAAYLPGYALATNSGTDGAIRSVIASRFPINRSRSWLTHSNLTAFGYNGPFTRDLFEAEIAVPGLAQPLHVFTTHLKAGSDATSMLRRAAEAAAISNFLVTVFLPTNLAPYLLTGDLNEDVVRSPTPQAVPTLTSAPTGLQLMTPTNPVSGSELTISIRSSLNARFDYILPDGLLFSNLVASQVFRTDLLSPLPVSLGRYDDTNASDHLPVMMVFQNPYDAPFRLLSIAVSDELVTVSWESILGQRYRVETSTDPGTWLPVATNITATGGTCAFSTNVMNTAEFYRVRREQ